MTELITIENQTVLQAFSTGDGIDQIIADARAIVDGHEPDLTTTKGRKEIASIAHKVAKLKTRLDGMGKDLTDEWRQKTNFVNASRKHLRDELDKLKDEARKPLTDWEDAEQERLAKHRQAIIDINEYARSEYSSGCKYTIVELEIQMAKLQEIVIDESFDEFELDAIKAKKYATAKLQEIIANKKEQIAKDEDLDRLRKADEIRKQKERDEELKREAAESARLKAEQKAQDELNRVESEKQALIDKSKADQAKIEQEKADAIKAKNDAQKKSAEAEANAKRAAIEQQQADEKREADELAKREANKRHVGKVRGEAKKALMKIVDEKTAKQIVVAVNDGVIPHIKIEY